jgi:hypothetical protein
MSAGEEARTGRLGRGGADRAGGNPAEESLVGTER